MATSLVSPLFSANAGLLLPSFRAYELDTACNPMPAYNRRDFYKVSLVTGHVVVQYADRSLELNGTHLFFANPRVPYTMLLLSAKVTGYACLFTEQFVQANSGLANLHQSSLFRPGGLPVCRLEGEQASYSTSMFGQMLAVQSTDYAYKGELIGSYLQLLLHEGLRMQRGEQLSLRYPPTGEDTLLLLR